MTHPPLQGGTPFIFEAATRGHWSGYKVTMQIPDGATVDGETCNGKRALAASYFVEAHLVEPIPGRRNFATDERGTIYQNSDGSVIRPGMAGATPLQ